MSSLPADHQAAHTQQARTHMFWLLLGALAAGQLFAFWLLCSHQMRKAEARHNETVVQSMALTDCLQYIPGSTIASCTVRDDVQAHTALPKPAMTSTLPVSFSFR